MSTCFSLCWRVRLTATYVPIYPHEYLLKSMLARAADGNVRTDLPTLALVYAGACG